MNAKEMNQLLDKVITQSVNGGKRKPGIGDAIRAMQTKMRLIAMQFQAEKLYGVPQDNGGFFVTRAPINGKSRRVAESKPPARLRAVK